ncbi:hypothetical protein LTR56_001116 [Elasticomyces elasticus]|nr:hypothetical protein LTR56_001116 [Elasticomyces elasticus]KAK3663516.1 hypothetical protein LTR22_005688 [Elasticomyces elasticus]KAK4927098.1 hypothetical protein LTR49_006013 [Elasticomyces elasticus]KAK5769037.1 hypothetical protein LTS12_000751 [Elasticomyces elasticus]
MPQALAFRNDIPRALSYVPKLAPADPLLARSSGSLASGSQKGSAPSLVGTPGYPWPLPPVSATGKGTIINWRDDDGSWRTGRTTATDFLPEAAAALGRHLQRERQAAIDAANQKKPNQTADRSIAAQNVEPAGRKRVNPHAYAFAVSPL